MDEVDISVKPMRKSDGNSLPIKYGNQVQNKPINNVNTNYQTNHSNFQQSIYNQQNLQNFYNNIQQPQQNISVNQPQNFPRSIPFQTQLIGLDQQYPQIFVGIQQPQQLNNVIQKQNSLGNQQSQQQNYLNQKQIFVGIQQPQQLNNVIQKQNSLRNQQSQQPNIILQRQISEGNQQLNYFPNQNYQITKIAQNEEYQQENTFINNQNGNTNFRPKNDSYDKNRTAIKKRVIVNYQNKFGLSNDSILLSEDSIQFNNYLSIQITGNDLNYITSLENFTKIIMTRDEKSIKHKHPNSYFLNFNQNNGISAEHAMFEVYNNLLYIGDLGSSNGTFRKLKNKESLALFPSTSFKFLNLNFSVEQMYDEGNRLSLEISVLNSTIFTIYSDQQTELSYKSTNQSLNSLIQKACLNFFGNVMVSGNFPIVYYDNDKQLFFLFSVENSVEEIHVKLDPSKQKNEDSINYDRFIVVQNGDSFLLSDVYSIQVSFLPLDNNYLCACNQQVTGQISCIKNQHSICESCSEQPICLFCIKDNCYCHQYNEENCESRGFFKCSRNTNHSICRDCYEFKYCSK